MITIILNDAPYGIERLYNGLRLALALLKKDQKVSLFLMGDAVVAAVKGQQTPAGFYNIERMIKGLLRRGASVHA